MRTTQTHFNVLLAALFLVAPLYFQPNLGRSGLHLAYNIPAWAIASLIICYAFYLVATRQKFTRPTHALAFLAFPVIIILSGILAGSSQPIPWLFRQLYIIGGVLYLFALFQFGVKQRHIELTLHLIVGSSLISAVIALLQVFAPDITQGWAPARGSIPLGIFQQVNVLATYLATGLAISLYLISRPSFSSSHISIKALLLASIFTNALVIANSGSRVGMLSAIASILLLAISRRRQFQLRSKTTIAAIICLTGGLILGGTSGTHSGFDKVTEKTYQVAKGAKFSARINMYTVALELVAEKPLSGHGIGNFLRVWNLQMGDYHKRNPKATLPPYVGHPHNEIVFWAIEGGAIALIGILLVIGAIILALIRCGFQRGTAYAALLVPISLHTQVELPFYISSIHWFLWLYLIFLPLRHFATDSTLSLSKPATQLIKGTAIVTCLGISYFMFHSARAHSEVVAFAHGRSPHLQIALRNLYFRPFAEELAMRALLHTGIQEKDPDKVRHFTKWAETRVAVYPELWLFGRLSTAYAVLGLEKERCRIVSSGADMYPINQPLQQGKDACQQQADTGNP